MFMGHYGPAIWDTRRGQAQPLIPLWQAFIAVQLIDILWAILSLFGIEGAVAINGVPFFDIDWSHSLLSSIVLAILAGAVFRRLKPEAGRRGFWVIAGLVFSHWVMDLIVHRPDLPLYPGGTVMLGFALWNFPWLAYALEMGLVLAAFLYWQKITTAKHWGYTAGLWVFFLFMAGLQFYSIVMPGLAVQAGTYDHALTPQGAPLALTALTVFLLMAAIIGGLEKGLPSKFIGGEA